MSIKKETSKPQPVELVRHYKRIYGNEEEDFRNANLRKLVISWLKPGTVLDVGCGTGRMSCDAYFAGHEVVVASDIEKRLLHFAKKNAKETGAKIKICNLSIFEIKKLGKEVFDNVICLDVIEHIDDDLTAIRNIKHVLKRNGRAVIVVPAHPSLYGKRDVQMGHVRRYTKKELASVLERNGFRIRKKRYWNLLGLFVYFFFEKIRGSRVNEKIRYAPSGLLQKGIHRIIFTWVKIIENNISFPIGLSLFFVAEKK